MHAVEHAVRWSVEGKLRFPAAGNRNDTNLNNVGSNGNYWSSSLNTDNPNNAWNVNFNSGNVNRNNNNRYNGQSVRPVTEFTMTDSAPIFNTSPSKLLLDLYRAYKDARRHKRSREYQIRFERNTESELVRLRDVILSGKYRPGFGNVGSMANYADFSAILKTTGMIEMLIGRLEIYPALYLMQSISIRVRRYK